MNPLNYQQLMMFKVVGKDDVLISHQGKSRIMAPGETWTLETTRIDALKDFRRVDCLPRISKMVNGNIHFKDGEREYNETQPLCVHSAGSKLPAVCFRQCGKR
jgi:hypothetical protein